MRLDLTEEKDSAVALDPERIHITQINPFDAVLERQRPEIYWGRHLAIVAGGAIAGARQRVIDLEPIFRAEASGVLERGRERRHPVGR